MCDHHSTSRFFSYSVCPFPQAYALLIYGLCAFLRSCVLRGNYMLTFYFIKKGSCIHMIFAPLYAYYISGIHEFCHLCAFSKLTGMHFVTWTWNIFCHVNTLPHYDNRSKFERRMNFVIYAALFCICDSFFFISTGPPLQTPWIVFNDIKPVLVRHVLLAISHARRTRVLCAAIRNACFHKSVPTSFERCMCFTIVTHICLISHKCWILVLWATTSKHMIPKNHVNPFFGFYVPPRQNTWLQKITYIGFFATMCF